MTHQEIKKALLSHCKDTVLSRRQKVLRLIANIEESLFEEGKSTAGDKHHTGRAMLQIDRENAGKQLQEVEKLEAAVSRIDIGLTAKIVKLGSVVETTTNRYFIGISSGQVKIGAASYYCISPGTPIGQLLMGLGEGYTFYFNTTEHSIVQLF